MTVHEALRSARDSWARRGLNVADRVLTELDHQATKISYLLEGYIRGPYIPPSGIGVYQFPNRPIVPRPPAEFWLGATDQERWAARTILRRLLRREGDPKPPRAMLNRRINLMKREVHSLRELRRTSSFHSDRARRLEQSLTEMRARARRLYP